MIKIFGSVSFLNCVRENVLPNRSCHYLRHISSNKFNSKPKALGYYAKRTKKYDRGSGSSLFVPIPVKTNPDDINVGVELSGRLKKQDLLKILTKFYQKPEIRLLSAESGLDDNLLHQAFISFRKHCIENDLPADLHVSISDILQGTHQI